MLANGPFRRSEVAYSKTSLSMRVVDSMKMVSWGGGLWKTTFVIDDLPLLSTLSVGMSAKLRIKLTDAGP